MRKSIKKYLPNVIVGHGILVAILIVGSVFTLTFHGPIVALVASATSSMSGSSATMYFTPYDGDTLSTGDTADIDVNINAKTPINAIGATIKYPPDSLEIVGISKKKSFLDLWTEDTDIKESSGEVHFSGGTTMIGGLTGTGTVLTLSVRIKKDTASAKLAVQDLQVYANDGKGTALDSYSHDFTYTITPKTPEQTSISSGSSANTPTQPTAPSADLNGDGKVNIIDVSIMTVHMLIPYSVRFDLDMDGKVGLSDLSILFSKM